MKKLLCGAVLVYGMLALSNGESVMAATADAVEVSQEAVIPDWGYRREYRINNISDWTQRDLYAFSYIGDWNNNGKVELEDAQEVLKAALRINEIDDVKSFQMCIKTDYEKLDLEDAKAVLKIALRITNPQDYIIYYPEFTPLYQSLEYGKISPLDSEREFREKRWLVHHVKYSMNNPELLEYVENLDEKIFENHSIVLTTNPVYAENLDDVRVNQIGLKRNNYGIGAWSRIEDKSADILDYSNQYYTELTLVSDNLMAKNGYYESFMVEQAVEGGESIKADIYMQDEQILDEGATVIGSMEELEEYKAFLKEELDIFKESWYAPHITQDDRDNLQYIFWDELELSEGNFETASLIVNVVYGTYYSDENNQMQITYTKENGNIHFNVLKEKYRQHVRYPSGRGDFMIVDLIWVDKELVAGCDITVETDKKETYIDFAPEQETFIVKAKAENLYAGSSLSITNEADKQSALNALADCYDADSDDYTLLYHAIENADVSSRDYMVLIGENQGCEVLQLPQQEKVYITILQERIVAVTDYEAKSFEPGKQAVILVSLEKGTLENRTVYNNIGY